MKALRVSSLIVAAVFSAVIAASAETNLGKVAYLNVDKVFDQYNKTKEYDEALSKKHEAYEAERNKRVEKIREATGKLSVLKEDERNKLQAQIDKDTAEFNEFDRQQQTDLRKERDEKMREILLEIEKDVNEYAEKEGYSLIINDKVLIFGKDEFDVTEQLIKILNEKYPGKK